jgi:hypothetical protein
MSVEVVFVVSDSMKSVTDAAGINRTGDEIPPCPLHVGDVISDPAARGLFFRVVSRWLALAGRDKPARWYVMLDQTPDPLAPLDKPHAPDPPS